MRPTENIKNIQFIEDDLSYPVNIGSFMPNYRNHLPHRDFYKDNAIKSLISPYTRTEVMLGVVQRGLSSSMSYDKPRYNRLRTKAKLFTEFLDDQNLHASIIHHNAEVIYAAPISETEKTIVRAYEAEKTEKDTSKANLILCSYVYDILSQPVSEIDSITKEQKINDFFYLFLVKDFTLSSKAALIRITKPFKKTILIRENLVKAFVKELQLQNCTPEQIEDILESIN